MLEARRGGWWDANKIGLCSPPIETEKGWLVIYHGVRQTASGSIYRLGLALFDLEKPDVCLQRGDSWMFGPEASVRTRRRRQRCRISLWTNYRRGWRHDPPLLRRSRLMHGDGHRNSISCVYFPGWIRNSDDGSDSEYSKTRHDRSAVQFVSHEKRTCCFHLRQQMAMHDMCVVLLRLSRSWTLQ